MPARSKSQQRLFGMLHAYNKGEFSGSKSLKRKLSEMSKHISDEDARHFAETKHKELPEKKAARLYTYLPKDNTVDTDGLLSTLLAPSGWEKYRGRTKKYKKEDVLEALDSWDPSYTRSKCLSAFAEPIPKDAHKDHVAFAKAKHLYSFDTHELLKAKILKQIRETNKGRGTHAVKEEDIGKNKADFSHVGKPYQFSHIPHYLVETKDGKIPPEFVRDEEKKAESADEYSVGSVIPKKLGKPELNRLVSLFRQLDDEEQKYDKPFGLELRKPTDKNLRLWLLKQHILAAKDKSGDIVGFANNNPASDYTNAGFISTLVVDKDHRGKGLGRRLLQEAIRRNKLKKLKSVLSVSVNNKAGNNLYESEGFNPINQIMVLDDSEKKASDKELKHDPDFIDLLARYKLKLGKDLSQMKLYATQQPRNSHGKKVEFPVEQFGGCWTDKGKVYVNSDFKPVAKHYGVKEQGLRKSILAHELAHEIWNKLSDKRFKEKYLAAARKEKFNTPYLKTVNPTSKSEDGTPKIDQETFCEYLSHLIRNKNAFKANKELPEKKAESTYANRDFVTSIPEALAAFASPSIAIKALSDIASRDMKTTNEPGIRYDPNRGSNTPENLIKNIKIDGKKIRKYLHEKGIGLHISDAFGPGTAGLHYNPNMDQLTKKYRIGNIHVGFKQNANRENVLGLFGHELGHAINHTRGKFNPKIYRLSSIITRPLGVMGNVINASGMVDAKTATGITLATMLAASPVLTEELRASHVGSRLVGLKGLNRLRSFAGVPTYMLLATSPAVSYGVRKALDKISNRNK